jgi:hypothetical protein
MFTRVANDILRTGSLELLPSPRPSQSCGLAAMLVDCYPHTRVFLRA